ncbi:MAG: LON peptidase substrate-binding domain-containing protein [Pirellulales bacterium]
MSYNEEDLIFTPEEFTGQVRLFPLPNLVLFPHVIQPLRVFEPRYVDLLHDALSSDRLIAMALLQPGWEAGYEGNPPIAPVACLGRVLTWQSQANQQYNLLLVGLRRVRIVREVSVDHRFRVAEAELLEDAYPPHSAIARPALHRQLAATFEEMLPGCDDAADVSNQVAAKKISLGTLTDVISYALDLDLPAKQALLAEPDVDRRAQQLLLHLQQPTCDIGEQRALADFPPAFSLN